MRGVHAGLPLRNKKRSELGRLFLNLEFCAHYLQMDIGAALIYNLLEPYITNVGVIGWPDRAKQFF